MGKVWIEWDTIEPSVRKKEEISRIDARLPSANETRANINQFRSRASLNIIFILSFSRPQEHHHVDYKKKAMRGIGSASWCARENFIGFKVLFGAFVEEVNFGWDCKIMLTFKRSTHTENWVTHSKSMMKLSLSVWCCFHFLAMLTVAWSVRERQRGKMGWKNLKNFQVCRKTDEVNNKWEFQTFHTASESWWMTATSQHTLTCTWATRNDDDRSIVKI